MDSSIKPICEMTEGWQKDMILAAKKLKARIRARVEPPFHVVKNIFPSSRLCSNCSAFS